MHGFDSRHHLSISAIHAMRIAFKDAEVLVVDIGNGFFR
jgi:hypothetical protein